ncbi:MAG: glucose-1-phosphate adenylyltransferase [Deltaproteobacteria bacterium]|nr:glucose-1-phosphate adenylyltransferase [Deltaproteobacteria bacterium]
MSRVYTVILGGGRGSRLNPLTRHRAKPAVPVGGKYRLIDITLSNAINSGFRDIAVLTQFNSASLNAHIARTYRFDIFGQGQVDVLAAEQTDDTMDWFQGTADAVRKQFRRLAAGRVEHVMILSGDHLYRMDYREIFQRHVDTGADATVSVIKVPRADVTGLGVLYADAKGQIRKFKEKPKADEDISDVLPPSQLRADWGLGDSDYLVNMGVYIFRLDALRQSLADPNNLDFGKDILPRMVNERKVMAHHFNGYWRDIGTIGSFYEANLALTAEDPPFRFHLPGAPIYTRQRFLPATKFLDARVSQSIISDGCILFGAEVNHAVIGIRSRVQRDAVVRDSYLMGADYYEDDDVRANNAVQGIIPIGIGRGSVVERAIIDKNARIGEGCVIRGALGRPDAEGESWFVRDGIVIVPKDATLPPGTVI